MEKVITGCVRCGYPIAVSSSGQTATCPNCFLKNTVLIAQSVVSSPLPWLVVGGIAGFILGRMKRKSNA